LNLSFAGATGHERAHGEKQRSLYRDVLPVDVHERMHEADHDREPECGDRSVPLAPEDRAERGDDEDDDEE
jgi:hypothetical protein